MCGSTYNSRTHATPDSLGNIYTGEVNSGKRAQKFVLKNGDGYGGSVR